MAVPRFYEYFFSTLCISLEPHHLIGTVIHNHKNLYSAGTPSIDRSIDIVGGGMPGTSQNGRGVQGECDRGSAMADRPQDDGPGNRRAPPRSSPIGCRWTFVRHCGRMSAQNSGQWPGLQRHGAPVKTQTWSATGGCDH